METLNDLITQKNNLGESCAECRDNNGGCSYFAEQRLLGVGYCSLMDRMAKINEKIKEVKNGN